MHLAVGIDEVGPGDPGHGRAERPTGVIRGYHADVALEALGRRVQALIAVRIRPPSREHIEAFRDWAGALPETVSVFVVSGGDDFLLHVGVPDTDACTRSSSTVSPSAARWQTCAHRSSTSTSAAPSSSRSVRIAEPDNHCTCAILACVKAIAAEPQVSSEQLAAELLELWHHLTRGASQQLYGLIADLDISITQMKTLHALDECADEVSVKELARRLGLSLPGASRTVDGLLRRGWLERREDPTDRRMKRVGITPDGRKIIDRIETARLAGLEDYAASLTPEQRATLSSALSNLPHRP
jgi:DNA-binding MarR family transcriptional regulator